MVLEIDEAAAARAGGPLLAMVRDEISVRETGRRLFGDGWDAVLAPASVEAAREAAGALGIGRVRDMARRAVEERGEDAAVAPDGAVAAELAAEAPAGSRVAAGLLVLWRYWATARVALGPRSWLWVGGTGGSPGATNRLPGQRAPVGLRRDAERGAARPSPPSPAIESAGTAAGSARRAEPPAAGKRAAKADSSAARASTRRSKTAKRSEAWNGSSGTPFPSTLAAST